MNRPGEVEVANLRDAKGCPRDCEEIPSLMHFHRYARGALAGFCGRKHAKDRLPSAIAVVHRSERQQAFHLSSRSAEVRGQTSSLDRSKAERLMNVQVTPAQVGAMRGLHGKVSLVTGSTSGIGLGIARAWQKQGPRSF
jgi:hypothetical protein